MLKNHLYRVRAGMLFCGVYLFFFSFPKTAYLLQATSSLRHCFATLHEFMDFGNEAAQCFQRYR